MDAVSPRCDAFEEQLRQASITPEKPLFAVLMTIHEAAQDAREAVKGGARGLSPEGERQLIERVTHAAAEGAEREVEQLARRIGFKVSVLMALAGLMLLGAGYVWGYLARGYKLRSGGSDHIAQSF